MVMFVLGFVWFPVSMAQLAMHRCCDATAVAQKIGVVLRSKARIASDLTSLECGCGFLFANQAANGTQQPLNQHLRSC